MASGIDRLLHQLSQLEIDRFKRINRHFTSNEAFESSLPIIKIGSNHVVADCAICKDPIEIEAICRELPCKHIYHSNCILTWLKLKNSCPVCRHQLSLATEVEEECDSDRLSIRNEDNPFGLTIFRFPGGGFAAIPVAYTEVDGVLSGVARTSVVWGNHHNFEGRRHRERGRGRRSRAFRSFLSVFRRFRIGSSRF